MHYYQHHIGDFIKDTSNLDDHQLATYLRMIWAYYDRETPITGAIEDIAFAVRSDEKTVRLLLRHFFTESESGWVHSRCDREIAAFHEKQEKAAKSANARWTNAKAMRTHTDRIATEPVFDANQEPITNNQEKEKESAADASPPKPKAPRKQRETPLPENFGVSPAVRAWAEKNGHTRLEAHLENFLLYARSKAATYADWDSAFMRAIRDNWAKLPAERDDGVTYKFGQARVRGGLVL